MYVPGRKQYSTWNEPDSAAAKTVFPSKCVAVEVPKASEQHSLRTDDVATVAEASYKFGKSTSLMSARPGRGWPPILKYFKFWFTVPEGFYALVTRHGALWFVIIIYVL